MIVNKKLYIFKRKHDTKIHKNRQRIKRDKILNKECKENKSSCVNLKVFSTNAAGLANGKLESFYKVIDKLKPNIICLQETHFRKKGRLRMTNYNVFESIRTNKGGGTLVACHKNLNPKLINEYSENFELITIEIKTSVKKIRIVCGYGPQENWPEIKRIPFFIALEAEIEKSKCIGIPVIIQMDANAKLGQEIIPGDPHKISQNGILLKI